ncbi:MAG: tetratricopeptide repeat protein [Spirochaetaceae bacterium]|jgi:tetratricopeptide (TPR) repeat protein|nr:tetratricopeptide repeat protein [Spirochaetaceae bacterium]
MRKLVVFTASACGLWTPAFQSTLTRAAKLARRGKYETAAQMLESEVYNYRDSFMFFYLLGLCSLYGGNYGGAYDYLMRAREIKPREPAVLLALAALYVKRSDTRHAISLYLEAQNIDSKSRIAKNALKILRKYSGSDDLNAWVEAGKLRSLYPRFPREKRKGALIARSVIAAAFAAAAIAVFVFLKTGTFTPPAAREGFAESVLVQSEIEKPLQTGGVFHFMLTEKQILSAYELARKLFNEGRDNAAMIEINRILESNAAEGIKNRARVMSRYLEPPSFETMKQAASDNIKYADAAKDPLLYRDCYAIWSGMAANIVNERTETSFDFLVGYDGRRVVEGVVRVVLPFAASVSPDYPLEVLGKILPVNSGEAMEFEGITIHQHLVRQ